MKRTQKPANQITYKGILFGGLVGFVVGKGWMGALFGAIVGYNLERELRRRKISAARYAGEAFARQAAQHRRDPGASGVPAAVPDPLAEAYRLFGLSSSASDGALKHAYRTLAKKYHPDALRAQGLSENAIRSATETMSKLNAAWSLIEKARHL
jgi:DnaJ like chaperone protein